MVSWVWRLLINDSCVHMQWSVFWSCYDFNWCGSEASGDNDFYYTNCFSLFLFPAFRLLQCLFIYTHKIITSSRKQYDLQSADFQSCQVASFLGFLPCAVTEPSFEDVFFDWENDVTIKYRILGAVVGTKWVFLLFSAPAFQAYGIMRKFSQFGKIHRIKLSLYHASAQKNSYKPTSTFSHFFVLGGLHVTLNRVICGGEPERQN